MIDRGSGTPVLLIPGIQGRWEWMTPAVDALATRGRVITDSLPGEPGSQSRIDPGRGFDSYLDWIDTLLTRAQVDRVALCGVSFGGWVALHYAARRPGRVSSLTLASTPSPTWRPSCRIERYLKAPRLMAPVFALSSPVRLYPEIAVAFPALHHRLRFCGEHLWRVTFAPMAPTLMAERMRLASRVDFAAHCSRISGPSQIVTGEPHLDRVVEVRSSHEYLAAIPGCRAVTIARTGHLAVVTRPDRFATIVTRFAAESDLTTDARREYVPA